MFQVNVKNAYLKEAIDTPIYIKQLPGFEDSKFPAKSLMQAGHIWNAMLHTFIMKIGFTHANSDL